MIVLRTLTNGRGDIRHYDHHGTEHAGRICETCDGLGLPHGYNGTACETCNGWGWLRLPKETR